MSPPRREQPQRKYGGKYEDVSPDDVVEDAVEFFDEGNDDPTPVTPPVTDREEEPPPPNA